MIEINSSALIGKGLHRECYVHPQDKNLCIKVAVNENIKETQREQKYYRFLKRKNICWDMLPKFYGNIDTNMGSGAVFDMIRNHDASVSKTLEHYLDSNENTESHYAGLVQSLALLKAYLLTENIITMTIKPKNILYQELDAENGRLFIVDNIGNSDLLPICNYSKRLGNKKILRKWQRFESSLLKTYPDNKALVRILANLN
ncbi:MAG: hypothetical protein DRR06_00870 [Gammaproteobacteria bacterium]|nr:MAG: hypothetical protein DRR06_00870 [Gammaproteobacteria bacterium]RLA49949.1 MAG: hypothetical protein DRR42_14445 [Gammaproteobacteria bacterium]